MTCGPAKELWSGYSNHQRFWWSFLQQSTGDIDCCVAVINTDTWRFKAIFGRNNCEQYFKAVKHLPCIMLIRNYITRIWGTVSWDNAPPPHPHCKLFAKYRAHTHIHSPTHTQSAQDHKKIVYGPRQTFLIVCNYYCVAHSSKCLLLCNKGASTCNIDIE